MFQKLVKRRRAVKLAFMNCVKSIFVYLFIYLFVFFPAFRRGSLAGHQAEKLKLSYKTSNKLEGIYNPFRGAEV